MRWGSTSRKEREKWGTRPTNLQSRKTPAAAWARWRQIRESVASPQFVSQAADVATAEIQSVQQQTPANGSKPQLFPAATLSPASSTACSRS
ncbi:MAG TPA: hypothetical protein VH088_10425 [Terriglobales bacterium]|nr:hypothetical protein [Terriglobales bacterium]